MVTRQQKIILIIDDTPANMAMLEEFLVQHEFDVLVAQDGYEGLQRAKWIRPHLILLDVMMPGIDGFETCRQLKALEETKDIPVIFMTALDNADDKVTGFEVGGVDYVTKPIHVQEVFARVTTHLNLYSMQQKLAIQNQELLSRNAELNELNTKLSLAHTQLLQSEKLASIGQLAAGVAHEINNPISYVLSNFSTLEKYLTDFIGLTHLYICAFEQLISDAEFREWLTSERVRIDLDYIRDDMLALMRESQDGIERVKKIVQDLRDFSRVDHTQKWESVNIHKEINTALNIAANEIKYKADVIKEYGTIPEIECLPLQLNQVIMNLLINAAQAIDKNERGKIIIRTGQEDTSYVWIEITDTGCGIQKDNLSRIFDPFFTTKPIGKGTGLGLSLSYGIVQKHQGHIDVQTEVGKGTSFRITLPIHQDQSALKE